MAANNRPLHIDTRELIDKWLIPARVRASVEAGKIKPHYMVYRKDMDRLPIDTFLIQCVMGTDGREFALVGRIVKPRDSVKYRARQLTPEQRLVYVCWSNGKAVRLLEEARQMICRYIVLPTDPEHDMIAAFKVACDSKRAWAGVAAPFKADLLHRALGVEPLAITPQRTTGVM